MTVFTGNKRRSKIITDPTDGDGNTISGSYSIETNDGGEVVAVIQHGTAINSTTGGGRSAVDPDSDKFNKLMNSDEVLAQRNLNTYGVSVDSYDAMPDDGVPRTDKGALEEEFNANNKKFNNENRQILENTAAEQNIAPFDNVAKSYQFQSGKQVSKKVLAYPLDIDIDQDHMKITRYEYFRPADLIKTPEGASKEKAIEIRQQNKKRRVDNFNRSTPAKGKDALIASNNEGSIILPMPKVVDTNGAEWGESKLNAVGLFAGQIAAGFGLGDIGAGTNFSNVNQIKQSKNLEKEARKQLDKRFKGERGTFGEGSQLLISSLVEGAGGIAGANFTQNEFLARTSGRVLNPNAELLFSGPVLRDFNFDFTMVARSEKEGDEIRRIVRFLKIGLAARFQSELFLRTPKIFKLEYRRGRRNLDTVNRFNPSGLALRTLAVDYAPNGYWSAYQDSQPVAIRLSMNFAELKPIYDEDQLDTPESSVGF